MPYRAKTVSEMTGIPRNTLIAWERRYGIPTPDRNEAGHRIYSADDVALLRRVKGLVDAGHRISEAVDLVRLDEGVAGDNQIPPAARDASAEVRGVLGERLLAFDRVGADRILSRLVLFSFRRAIDEVYLPLMVEVGDRWEAGEITVAQEHFASAWCREQLVTMLHSLEWGPDTGRRVVCAGYPGERHELGLLAAAVKLSLRGLDVRYLGVDLPLGELLGLIDAQRPEVVCQSVVHQRSLVEIREHARTVARALPEGGLLAIGGRGVAPLVGEEMKGVLFCRTVEELLIALGA